MLGGVRRRGVAELSVNLLHRSITIEAAAYLNPVLHAEVPELRGDEERLPNATKEVVFIDPPVRSVGEDRRCQQD